MAIVSTFDELCGIAAYTRYLLRQLENDFDIDVLELDQYLLRSRNPRVRRLGDAHIRDICSKFKDYDVVNIQLEHGTIGGQPADIKARFKALVKAAPQVSVTFHTMLAPQNVDFSQLFALIGKFEFLNAIYMIGKHVSDEFMERSTAGVLAKLQKRKPVSVIVHTRRDMRHMRYVHGLRSVFDHPLSFLSPHDVTRVRSGANRGMFPIAETLPSDAIVIGVFGFLGRYKGFDTVIAALQRLPERYHLLIFGGVHPNEIRRGETISPFVKLLLNKMQADRTMLDALIGQTDGEARRNLNVSIDLSKTDVFQNDKDISRRIHFMGALSDDDFISGMAISDVVVMPYLEVGQSSSGPISQALELGCRVIASRTQAFLQLARYQEGMLEFFDIGNHVELADRIQSVSNTNPGGRRLPYNVTTNRAIYVAANSVTPQKAVDGQGAKPIRRAAPVASSEPSLG